MVGNNAHLAQGEYLSGGFGMGLCVRGSAEMSSTTFWSLEVLQHISTVILSENNK